MQIAEKVKEATVALNAAIEEAHGEGLRVDVSLADDGKTTTTGRVCVVQTKIFQPLWEQKTMSKITFKFPCDIEAKCRITGFKGTIVARKEHINGAVQYAIQPKIGKEDSNFVDDAKLIDEGYVQPVKPIPNGFSEETVEFKYSCGDKVRNFINGFEGVVVARTQWLNGCISYVVEGQIIKNELHGIKENVLTFWEQEIEAVMVSRKGKDPAPASVPTSPRRTGGPMETLRTVESI